MHISIGAAILIIGLLYLATSKAGLKVLGVLALVGVVGGAGFSTGLGRTSKKQQFARSRLVWTVIRRRPLSRPAASEPLLPGIH